MAADGVDKRSSLLSASHSGNITPMAPPYLTRKQPQSGTPTSVHSSTLCGKMPTLQKNFLCG
uniref:Uncharacterized protein n=1 Tax=Balaenoptera musculus TaxID=9771 RepID=A0A8C0E6I6_BALMU